jgi:hypothetical protein
MRFILPVLTALILLVPNAARAEKQTMYYEVYAGGIHALQARLDINIAKGRYDIVLKAQTRGFLGKMAPWEGIFESHGWVEKDGTYKPELHKSTAIWRGEKEVKDYKYTRDGHFLGLIETVDGKKPKEKPTVDAELTEGTTDALTGALNVLEIVGEGGKCDGSEEVFDGKRRFKQIFKHKTIAELVPTKYNIFKGPAAECTVEVKPVAGEWHKKPRGWMSIQEQGRERGTMPTMWAAKLAQGDSPAVPVKIRVSTAYGVLFMHLAEFSDSKRTVVADKREKE